MRNYKVVKYSSLHYKEWNAFVLNAKNATFLFHRNFIEYHQDRFEDYSLMVYSNKKLMLILPANIEGQVLYSHQGLSYGSLVLPNKIAFQNVLEGVHALLKFLSNNNINVFVFKQIPKIYNLRPSDEMEYFLFILKAKLFRKDVSMTIPLANKLEFSSLRKRQLKLAMNSGLNFVLNGDMTSFWNEILTPNLKEKHGVKPVHTLSEIMKLREMFPNNIKQYNVYYKDELLAGCTVFETKCVAHAQYMSTRNNNKGALDYLINQLISNVYKDKDYFDFGMSNENQGMNINEGLLQWKQSFGASSVIHDFYQIDVANYTLLKEILI
ncbi:GNAT family N-acetyltransferase [Flavivirga spongiicola]|uniref:GNAT family N-acetyltransferase n=1 Tax=Flavivirga spongiicola TaxID=421621 RepID=A0ABU7XWE8_9FLAO|nr:GNAT family N-acetyltransferase [Flavivirga sp. MEBiC05379]MDO5980108.1 GNAT family N-acetyltransferase [Flavivirga sp. MEBiC05379]